MAHKEPPIDWAAVFESRDSGRLMELLAKLPHARWAERTEYGHTFLHHACTGANVAAVLALLTSGLVDVNARTKGGYTAAHYAASKGQSRVLELLCAAGAKLRVRDENSSTPLDNALKQIALVEDVSARVLVANGMRLSTVDKRFRHFISPELEAFERGVLRCRAAVVAMLRVKHAGRLVRWDKFLLAEMALCIWSTRCDKGWQLH